MDFSVGLAVLSFSLFCFAYFAVTIMNYWFWSKWNGVQNANVNGKQNRFVRVIKNGRREGGERRK